LTEKKKTLRLQGGTIENPVPIKQHEILCRRHGLKAVTAYFLKSDQPEPLLHLSLHTQYDIKPDKTQKYLLYIPPHLIVPTKNIECIKMYQQILCDTLLTGAQPLSVGAIQDPIIPLFARLMNEVDCIHVLSEYYLELKKQLNKSLREDEYTGLAGQHVKMKFREAVLHLYNIVCTKHFMISPLVVSINDTIRLTILREAIRSNPQLSLGSDGLDGEQKSVRPASFIHSVDQGPEYRNTYQPFHTAEIIHLPTQYTHTLQLLRSS
jgi:hypothetical protein